jgi:hypothetical protein
MFVDAQLWLSAQAWCEVVDEGYFGFGIGNIIAVFLFRIQPSAAYIGDHVWVIRGDIPPAFIDCRGVSTPQAALREYVSAMRSWAVAVKSGQSPEGCIQVNAPPTRENAIDLLARLEFVEKYIANMDSKEG